MEHRQIFPRPGWVEHDADEILEKALQVIVGTLAKTGISPSEVEGLGITNQRETVVLWNRFTGRPVHNALVWQDTRTEELCRHFDAFHGTQIRQLTGLPVATYFSATKLRWLMDHVAGARRAAESGDLLAGTVDSWLIWKLTGGPQGGVHATDPTNAARTQLMNLQTLQWDQRLLDLFTIPRALLPEIRTSSEVYGNAVLSKNLPIAAVLGDQQAALFGQAGFQRGDAKNTYGTGAFLLMNTGSQPIISESGLLTTVLAQVPGEKPTYGLEGSVAMAGATIHWLRDNWGLIASNSGIEDLAQTVKDNGGVYFVPAFSGLYAPYWRPDARGVIVGLTRYANRGHLARAALEAVAYQTRDVIEAMETDTGLPISTLKVDGGMTANRLFLQLQADILGRPVTRPRVAETTALGAAYAAGLALGYWKNKDELHQHWEMGEIWRPRLEPHVAEAGYSQWKKAVSRSLGWEES